VAEKRKIFPGGGGGGEGGVWPVASVSTERAAGGSSGAGAGDTRFFAERR